MKIQDLFEEERSIHSVRGPLNAVYDGDYRCSDFKLTSLEGAPHIVKGRFNCNGNKLTSLKGGPHTVEHTYDCAVNYLTTLEGAPRIINKSFYCSSNDLRSLEGGPATVGGVFDCNNVDLISLRGAPQSIGIRFVCYDNELTSLKGVHKIIKHIGDSADFTKNPIKSHVLGLLMIDGLKSVSLSNKKVEKIMNKHLKGDRDIFACQEELIEAGFPKFAQL